MPTRRSIIGICGDQVCNIKHSQGSCYNHERVRYLVVASSKLPPENSESLLLPLADWRHKHVWPRWGFVLQQNISQVCRLFSPHDEEADAAHGAPLELRANRSSPMYGVQYEQTNHTTITNRNALIFSQPNYHLGPRQLLIAVIVCHNLPGYLCVCCSTTQVHTRIIQIY